MYKIVVAMLMAFTLFVMDPAMALAKATYKGFEAGTTNINEVADKLGRPIARTDRQGGGWRYTFVDKSCHKNELYVSTDSNGIVCLIEMYPQVEFNMNFRLAREKFGYDYSTKVDDNGRKIDYYLDDQVFVEYYRDYPTDIMCLNFYGPNFLKPSQPKQTTDTHNAIYNAEDI